MTLPRKFLLPFSVAAAALWVWGSPLSARTPTFETVFDPGPSLFHFTDPFQSLRYSEKDSSTGSWFHPGNSDRYTGIRRSMLRGHQLAGLFTWSLWLATNLEGERALKHLHPDTDLAASFFYLKDPSRNLPLSLAMKYDTPSLLLLDQTCSSSCLQQNLGLYYLVRNNVEWESRNGSTHTNLAMATMGVYFLTASLALTAPSRYNATDSNGVDSIFFHKGLAILHLAAMVALPALGRRIEHGGPDAARAMQNTGWAGFGALTLAVGVVYF